MARRTAFGFLIACGIALLLLAFTYQSVFSSLGGFLVESQQPEKADAVVVLAGDPIGGRILRGAELVASGFAPIALISGPYEMYGVNEADLAIQFAVRHGVPARYFEPAYLPAKSTFEEAVAFAPFLRKRNIRKVLLVTTNFHTHRAASTWRRVMGPSVEIYPVAAPDRFFRPDSWWRTREGKKTVFYEYSRTLGGWLGL